ncbi:unnamed protein product [Effrenium voratum]|nr:unnamed protein product [Effrenium voratum]
MRRSAIGAAREAFPPESLYRVRCVFCRKLATAMSRVEHEWVFGLKNRKLKAEGAGVECRSGPVSPADAPLVPFQNYGNGNSQRLVESWAPEEDAELMPGSFGQVVGSLELTTSALGVVATL